VLLFTSSITASSSLPAIESWKQMPVRSKACAIIPAEVSPSASLCETTRTNLYFRIFSAAFLQDLSVSQARSKSITQKIQ